MEKCDMNSLIKILLHHVRAHHSY